METRILSGGIVAILFGSAALAQPPAPAPDPILRAEHSAALIPAHEYGPQSPRDLDQHAGANPQVFGLAPEASKMTLCNIHLHESAEHKGGDFTTPAGTAAGGGFGYNGSLTKTELTPPPHKIGASDTGDLVPGDTIEAHFVYSTARATLGKGLASCFTKATQNPQLRVEAVVGVLVNDVNAVDFTQLTRIEETEGQNQLPNLPGDLGAPTVYNGSTTGTAYDDKSSPVQVTWSVRPKVAKIDIGSLDRWFQGNPFAETQAHGVRDLVTDPALLSQIE